MLQDYIGLGITLFLGLASWIALRGSGMKRLADAVAVSTALAKTRAKDRPFLEARFYRLLRRDHFRGRLAPYLVATAAVMAISWMGMLYLPVWPRLAQNLFLVSFSAIAIFLVIMGALLWKYVLSGESEATAGLAQRERAALQAIVSLNQSNPSMPIGLEGRYYRWLARKIRRRWAWVQRHKVLSAVVSVAFVLAYVALLFLLANLE